jgi:TPR repeat protein
MKKIIVLLYALLSIVTPNLLLAQDVTPEMIQQMEIKCNANVGLACELLGEVYHGGQDVKQDYFKAVEYSTKACKLDDGLGCRNLGVAYAKGQGVRLDIQKAKEYFGKACDLKEQIGCDNYRKMSEMN